MKNRTHLLFFTFCIFPFLAGCALKPKYLIQNYAPPQRIAVLPFTNQSLDLDASIILRTLFNDGLSKRGYSTVPLGEIDEKLKELGITDAGQFPTVRPVEISKKLNADGLLYGEVIEFKYTTLGFYYSRTVHANFKLVDSRSEQLLWEDERKVSNKKFKFEKIGEAFASQIADKFVDKLLRSPLKEEAERVVNESLRTIPRRLP